MKSLVLMCSFMFLIACSTGGQETNRFTPEELIGHRLSLVSKTGVGEFSFMKDGHVVATVGTVGGPIAGPVLEWQIDSQGRIVIDFNDFKQTWKKLSVQGNLIEIEGSTGPSKPHRHEYIIRTGKAGAAIKHYPNNSFTTAELAGSTLIFDINMPGRKYTFNTDGTGTFSVDPQEGIELSKDESSFRWSVDAQGTLLMTRSSGKVMIWKKISRENDIIVAEFTYPPSPPKRATYRRSKITAN